MIPSTHPRVLALLLRALLDFTPGPASSLRRPPRELSPWSPGEWRPCPSCRATGKSGGRGPGACPRCSGAAGWMVDPYDREERRIEAPGSRAMSLPELERLCERLEQPPPEPSPLLDAIARNDRYRGDVPAFQDLRHTLQTLRAATPAHYSAIVRALVLELEPLDHMDRRDQLLVLDGLRLLAAALPDGWRAPRWAQDRAEAEQAADQAAAKAKNGSGRWADPAARRGRDREIRKLAGAGFGARAIGRRLSVSHSTVLRVLQGQEAA